MPGGSAFSLSDSGSKDKCGSGPPRTPPDLLYANGTATQVHHRKLKDNVVEEGDLIAERVDGVVRLLAPRRLQLDTDVSLCLLLSEVLQLFHQEVELVSLLVEVHEWR